MRRGTGTGRSRGRGRDGNTSGGGRRKRTVAGMYAVGSCLVPQCVPLPPSFPLVLVLVVSCLCLCMLLFELLDVEPADGLVTVYHHEQQHRRSRDTGHLHNDKRKRTQTAHTRHTFRHVYERGHTQQLSSTSATAHPVSIVLPSVLLPWLAWPSPSLWRNPPSLLLPDTMLTSTCVAPNLRSHRWQ